MKQFKPASFPRIPRDFQEFEAWAELKARRQEKRRKRMQHALYVLAWIGVLIFGCFCLGVLGAEIIKRYFHG